MTGDEHYRAAEKLLGRAGYEADRTAWATQARPGEDVNANHIAAAHVHAMLAVAASNNPSYGEVLVPDVPPYN
ncbi:hypothetical protein ACIA8K_32545 [Catenuloplanes sp. NPDC051500]|uniref:hypothetical protein n=1 Tax=Catenuloplanes sp. NPDC051500 TaxID=3363959 RepID=UPI00378DAD53